MKLIKNNLCLSVCLLAVSVLTAQEKQEDVEPNNIIPNSQLVWSNPSYPVTAGDIYTLTYMANNTAVTYQFFVDSSYMVRISNLGTISAANKTFLQLKREAETIVANNYPLSGAQLILTRPGMFRVFVIGEVSAATEISTWAMERLSSLISYATPFASLRNVTIKSANGQEKTYDLFNADRTGDLSQNPYLRPNDTITFNRLERQITINGAVERPGIYQLLANENLKDLIEVYACGLTPLADKSRMELIRYVGGTSPFGEKISIGNTNIQENFILQNYDIVTIPDVREWWPPVSYQDIE
jgi:protein involved in polysaccharide export with SLBB domain